MKCLSLFSGIGGFDLACRRVGIEIIGACEIDKHARSIYSRHFPGVPIHRDATKINPEKLPDFDIICAGFPCQAFSIAGRRLGFEESRGTLFFEIARIAKQKRPGFLLLENVTGLLSHDNGRTFANILATLDELGYNVEWQVHNSKSKTAQSRERIFIFGYSGKKPRQKIFSYSKGEGTAEQKIRYVRNHESQSMRIYRDDGLMPTLLAIHRYFGSIKSHIIQTEQGLRYLTPKECERLQGFPDDFTKYGEHGEEIKETHRYKALGNAVTVPIVEEILRRIKWI